MFTEEEFTKVFVTVCDAIHFYGGDAQMDKIREECLELVEALDNYQKLLKEGASEESLKEAEFCVADETADVFVVALQSAIMVGPSKVRERFLFKVNRLHERIELESESE